MMTDPVADMLTRIRNANTAMHDEVRMPSSKLKEARSKSPCSPRDSSVTVPEVSLPAGGAASPFPSGAAAAGPVAPAIRPAASSTAAGSRRRVAPPMGPSRGARPPPPVESTPSGVRHPAYRTRPPAPVNPDPPPPVTTP